MIKGCRIGQPFFLLTSLNRMDEILMLQKLVIVENRKSILVEKYYRKESENEIYKITWMWKWIYLCQFI